MNILVTGGGGFIGSHLVDSQLAQGHRVRTVDLNVVRLAAVAGHPNLEIVAGDITDQSLVDRLACGIDVVYHLASAHLSVTSPDAHYHRVNVEATAGILEAARQAGVRRLVHCSSNGVMGDVRKPPADETTPCNPTNIYERTKLAGELVALQWAVETGLAVVVARPAWVYGPRCPRTRRLFRTIEKRRFMMFGDGRTLRHPLYVSDAVRGLELCAETDNVTGQIFILAGERPVKIQDLVRLIAEVLEVPPPTGHLPVVLGRMAGVALQSAFKPLRQEPPFSRRSMDFFLKNNAYNTGKAQRELGFRPMVDLRTGVTKTVHWLRDQNRDQSNRPRVEHG